MRPKFFKLAPNTNRNIIKILSDDNVTTVGRIVFSQ